MDAFFLRIICFFFYENNPKPNSGDPSTEEADIQAMERLSRVASVDAPNGDDGESGPLPFAVVEHLGAQQLKDLLTEQQQRSIADMYNLLRQGTKISSFFNSVLIDLFMRLGITVFKHGRSGKQHLRRLYCDIKMEYIYWRELRGFDDGESSDNFDLSAAEEEERSQKRRSHFIRFSKGDDDRKILISDIIEVRDDLSTDVARRPLSKPSSLLLNNMETFPSSAICIILPYRMVDFEVDDVRHYCNLFSCTVVPY